MQDYCALIAIKKTKRLAVAKRNVRVQERPASVLKMLP